MIALDYKRLEPQSEEELAKLTGEDKDADADYRARKLERRPALGEEGPSCAITQPQEGDRILLGNPDGFEVKGYALGGRGKMIMLPRVGIGC